MATLYIEEFQGLGMPQLQNMFINAPLATALLPSIAQAPITISGSSTPSQPFNAKTILIRVHTDAICSLKVGGFSPVATTSNMRFAANQTEYFGVQGGEALAVIQNV